MIATFTALLAQVVAVVVVYMEFADGPGTAGSLLVELMLFVAKFSGGIALLATPVVYVVRSKRPPLAITVAVVIVALTPWVISGSPA